MIWIVGLTAVLSTSFGMDPFFSMTEQRVSSRRARSGRNSGIPSLLVFDSAVDKEPSTHAWVHGAEKRAHAASPSTARHARYLLSIPLFFKGSMVLEKKDPGSVSAYLVHTPGIAKRQVCSLCIRMCRSLDTAGMLGNIDSANCTICGRFSCQTELAEPASL